MSKRRSSYVVKFFPSLSPDFLVLSNTFPPDTIPTPLPPLYISLTPEHFAKKKAKHYLAVYFAIPTFTFLHTVKF